jgi:DNA-binding NarL/FixJ family response regulator
MLIEAIRSISGGRTWLSPKAAASGHPLSLPGQNLTEREAKILEQMLLDRSENEIAAALGLKESRVAKHVKFLMKKFDVKSIAALKDLARSLGTVPTGGSASPPRSRQ